MSVTTFTWTNAGTGDWNIGSNWNTGTVANGSAIAALINNAGTAVVQNGSDDTLASLAVGPSGPGSWVLIGSNFTSTLATPGTLAVSGAVSVGTGAELAVVNQSSTFSAAGGLTNAGIIGGGGTITAAITNTGSVIADGEIDSFGSLVINGAIGGAGVVDIDGGATLVLNGIDTDPIFADAPFTPTGTSVLELGSGISATGTINLSTGNEFDLFLLGRTVSAASIAGSTLTATTSAGTETYTLANATGFTASPGSSPGEVVLSAAVCFARGTRIATPSGEVAVEHLVAGDTVLTARGEERQVIWIGHRHLDCSRHPQPHTAWPVRIKAGAFGHNKPHRDLLLSPQHAIFDEGVLIPVKYLVNGGNVVIENVATVEYYHVELARHDVLLAEGLPAESYLENGDRDRFENSGRPMRLHPDFSVWSWDARACAEMKVVGPEVERVKAKLARAWQNEPVIPGDRKVDRYARGVGGAAAREIKGIPAGRPQIEGSNVRPAGITAPPSPSRAPSVASRSA